MTHASVWIVVAIWVITFGIFFGAIYALRRHT